MQSKVGPLIDADGAVVAEGGTSPHPKLKPARPENRPSGWMRPDKTGAMHLEVMRMNPHPEDKNAEVPDKHLWSSACGTPTSKSVRPQGTDYFTSVPSRLLSMIGVEVTCEACVTWYAAHKIVIS